MIITSRRWADLPDGSLIVGPSGTVWRIASRPAFGVARLADPETGEVRDVTAPPADFTTAILSSAQPDDAQRAIAILSQFFTLERI